MSSYLSVTGILTQIQPLAGNDGAAYGCTLALSVRTQNSQEVQFTMNGDTYVVDNVPFNPGDRVTVFYDADAPAQLIYPPRYQAEIVTMLWRNQSVALAYFDENLLAADQSLQLNLDRQVKITTANGQSYNCSPGNAELLVYYTAVTRSIPPMTTPQKIIVLCPE